jgi:ribose transport system ATP-binding protein
MAIIYISHTVPDVLRLADRLLVLRDGAAVAQREARGCTEGELISLMVGRDLGQLFPEPGAASASEIVFEARGISQPGVLHDINFQLHKGELLGIAGLLGSGRSELARALFGLDACAEGEIRLNHSRLDGLSTRARMRKGLAFLTENRRADGLLMLASSAANLTLVTPDQPAVPKVAADIRLHSADLNRQPVQQLSGGNQQKVAFGKWLLRLPQVLMVDEPTRGIDVGARQEIYRIMRNLAGQGIGLLVISSEIEELMGLCDRILVMRRGEIRATLARAEFHRERILQEAI